MVRLQLARTPLLIATLAAVASYSLTSSSVHAQQSTTFGPENPLFGEVEEWDAAQPQSEQSTIFEVIPRTLRPWQDSEAISDGQLSANPNDGTFRRVTPQYDGDLTRDGQFEFQRPRADAFGPSSDERSFLPAAQSATPDGDLSSDGRLSESQALQSSNEAVSTSRSAVANSADSATINHEVAEQLQYPVGILTAPALNQAAEFDEEQLLENQSSDPFEQDDAYVAQGIRVGNFIVSPEVITGIRLTDNVLQTAQERQADLAFELQPAIRIISDWNVHGFEFVASGLLTYYRDFPNQNDRDADTIARARLDINDRTNVTTEAGYSLSQEDRNNANLPSGTAEPPDVETRLMAAAISHRINRLGFRLRGTLATTDYSDALLIDGEVDPQNDRDFNERGLGLRGEYEFHPGLAGFVEGAIFLRRFKRPARSDGILRDSKGFEATVGLEGDIGPTMNGTFAVGFIKQRPDDRLLDTIDGFVLDANLTWRPTALTTIGLTAATDIESTSLADSAAQLIHTVGMSVEHAFRRYFIGRVGLAYQKRDSIGIELEEQQLTGDLGLEYLFDPNWGVVANYQHIKFDSNGGDRDYDENIFQIGVRLRP